MKKILAVAVVLMLSACVTTGRKVSQEQVAQFKEGRTTYQEVVEALGEPTSSTLNSDGSRTIIYSYASAQARPESFIPYIGPLLAGSTQESSNVIIQFDRKGVLQHYTASSGKSSTGTGLISGQGQ